jgi:hypothetical protein
MIIEGFTECSELSLASGATALGSVIGSDLSQVQTDPLPTLELSKQELNCDQLMSRKVGLPLFWLRFKSLPVLYRREKCLDHFRIYEVAIELIQFAQPKIITVEV